MQNRLQDGECAMNCCPQTLHFPDAPSATPNWPQQFQNWRNLLSECAHKPVKGRVHALRVATLRLVAEVDRWLRERGYECSPNRAAKHWNTQAAKLRRALSKVRETDVHLGQLEDLRRLFVDPAGYQPRSSQIYLRQIGQLQRALSRERRDAANRLTRKIEARRDRLHRASREIESHILTLHTAHPDVSARAVLDMLSQAASDFPKLDAQNLHDFRKRIKKVRYLAERVARADPQTKKLDTALKQMQAATGEWHDRHTLAKVAARALRDQSKFVELTELIKTLTEESLHRALDLCEHRIAQFACDGSQKVRTTGAPSEKVPDRRVLPWAGSEERHIA